MEPIRKGKQTNKQVEVACVEVWMQGVVRSCITCRVQYTMCQSMWKSFRDASEMHRKSTESDTQGHTLTTCSLRLLPTGHSHPALSHCLDRCHIPLLLTLRPHCILSPPTYGPGLHPSGEERPSSWSLLQLWQTRPHHEGLLRTTCPEHPEHRCYNNSETHS